METKNTAYMPDLDVLRALAALTVFMWHYLHSERMPAQEAYWPGLAIFEEGHIGVSLFMVLSGFLFFKITYRNNVRWDIFALNRVKRIFPLLFITQAMWIAAGYLGAIPYTPHDFIVGVVQPTWAGGAWSIAVELHFYLMLPAFLGLAYRSPVVLLGFTIAIIILRTTVPSLQDPSLSYYTIIGRIDQFLIGALVFLYWSRIPRWTGVSLFIFFIAYLELFNLGGGHARFLVGEHLYFSMNFIRWTVEGLGFAGLMIWILKSDWRVKETWLWSAIAWVGTVSYSVYLLHFFVLRVWFRAMEALDLGTSARMAFLIPCLASTLLVSAISYQQIEKRFLRMRAKYIEVQ